MSSIEPIMGTDIVLLQHNLGRGRVTSGELLKASHDLRASILLVQEPSTVRGKTVCCLGTTINRILTGTKTATPLACVVITDPKLDVLHLTQFNTTYCVCAQVTSDSHQFYVISIYLPPYIPIHEHIHHLRTIAHSLRPASIIVGGDLNAISHLW